MFLASLVIPAICGVIIIFKSCRFVKSLFFIFPNSSSNTSVAYPSNFPLSSAGMMAFSSTISPLEVFIRYTGVSRLLVQSCLHNRNMDRTPKPLSQKMNNTWPSFCLIGHIQQFQQSKNSFVFQQRAAKTTLLFLQNQRHWGFYAEVTSLKQKRALLSMISFLLYRSRG